VLCDLHPDSGSAQRAVAEVAYDEASYDRKNCRLSELGLVLDRPPGERVDVVEQGFASAQRTSISTMWASVVPSRTT
jgi:hypothetical protein